MKFVITFALLSFFVSGLSFAAETKTKCPYMIQDERNNPKANLDVVKPVANRRPRAVQG